MSRPGQSERDSSRRATTASIYVAMTITFCTFNIRYGSASDGDDCWDNRRGLVCDLWRTSGWDVVGIQEGLRDQIDHIRGHVPEYAEVGVGRNDGVSDGEHCAILYRADRFDLLSTGTFWLSKTPDIVGSRHPGTRHARICTWAHLSDIDGGRAFWIYNAHTDHELQEARQWSSDLIIERVRCRNLNSLPFREGLGVGSDSLQNEGVGSDPVVVMGDFNANADNPAIMRLTAGRLPRSPSTPTPPSTPPTRKPTRSTNSPATMSMARSTISSPRPSGLSTMPRSSAPI